jgi:molybdopterin-guanine dinucleotide biosynthesis protein A
MPPSPVAPSHVHPSASVAPLTGVILAGGRATRFGGNPKGLAVVGSARILDRVAGALAEVTAGLLMIAHASDADRWLPGVAVAGDLYPGCGALGGLHAALAHAAVARAGTDVLVVAWDMPFVTASLLRTLIQARHDAAADAVLPVHPDGHDEPLCALYAARCAAVAERLLQRGERRAGALADAVDARRVPPSDLAPLGDPRTLLLSVNAPADLAHAHALIAVPHPEHGRS